MAIPDSWGMSWNDPNGQGGSDRHISAYCNMTDTSAIIKKNQRMHINARKITQDRRHPRQQMLTRAIHYDTSSRQMKASAELSAECHQSFQVQANISINLIITK